MTSLISSGSMLVSLSMLAVTCSIHLVSFFTLRSHTLSKRVAAVMGAVPDCVLISVIVPCFVSDKPHKLTIIALATLAVSRLSILSTVLVDVAALGLFGCLLQ